MLEATEILKLYNVKPPLELIDKYFAEDCDFEAHNIPSFKVKGIHNIHEIFKAIGVYAKDIKILKYTSTNSQHHISIDTIQNITFSFLPFTSFNYRMIINVHKQKDKITRFEEIMDLESLLGNIPLVNYGYFNIFKPMIGNLMIRAGGLNHQYQTKPDPKIAAALNRLNDHFVEESTPSTSQHSSSTNTAVYTIPIHSKFTDEKEQTIKPVWNRKAKPISN
ncbi:hypothetical protein DLAC_00012 [Tieghemostelium lacteum]|uniref:SigF-like NTF2-like domain-containing protein n=1 Tax=Tieghemostelium lacteum TaxID=361077 RepID=A0A152A8L8_TIELA|nr:hypothetical protein DLAC_00012 [Tieghemostelium lacteum]|eukprot:KYR02573.1 hypothetical protein DLAC_00012 [Tieghemostelium lacteum]